MAGIKKERGSSARRVADALRRFRRGQDATTAEIARRLDLIGHPIADTGITKTEHGTRRVDVDDLVPLAVVLGVTPNTLLMPPVAHLGAGDRHELTPVLTGTAERLWQWAQGERPLRTRLPGAASWLGGGEHPDLEFALRCRPYLTALHPPGPPGVSPGEPDPRHAKLSAAVLTALADGLSAVDVRRNVELTIMLPAVMSPEDAGRWVSDRIRPGEATP